MTDITFNGGIYGASIGNQQFTMRNLVFNNCVTAISQLWDWGWTYQGISINNCQRGIDLSAGGSGAQNIGSVILIDSSITNTPVGIVTSWTQNSSPATAGSLILENVQLTNVPVAIQQDTGGTILAGTGGSMNIAGWGQGHQYIPGGPSKFQGPIAPINRPPSLLSPNGKYYVQSKPQYGNLPVSSFRSARAGGAAGNGIADDTSALQQVINSATAAGALVFVDAGTYRVTSTLFIPPGARIVGEGYSVIMSSGAFFNDMSQPRPVVKVGNPGDDGHVELSDLILSTQGQQMGATLLEWNLASSSNAPSGMWDVHVRIAGFAGSGLSWTNCPKQPDTTGGDGQGRNNACIGAFMSMHITPSANGLYMENCWLWTGDHDIDDVGLRQITVYNGRGLLIESTVGNIWLYVALYTSPTFLMLTCPSVGTGVEHNVLYQYQLVNTQNIYMGFIQTETPYYQPNPQAPIPFVLNTGLQDPNFDTACAGQSGNCRSAWGLRVVASKNILVYGAGLYSFFDNYKTSCSNSPGPENCQNNILSLEGRNENVVIYALSTIGTTNMVTIDGRTVAKYSDNINVFPDTIALLKSGPVN
jgi:glucan 1,3-beta-glucosidase